MTAALVRDQPGWEYPGGAARLLVWGEDAPGEAFTLAVVSQDEGAPGTSVTNAMDQILAGLAAEYSDDVQVVQHHLTSLRHELWDIGISAEGQPVWFDTDADQLAEVLGMAKEDLLAVLESW